MQKSTIKSKTHYYLHSCFIAAMFMGMNGDLAAFRGLRISRHNLLEILVNDVVTRQNAARVFITGRGLPDLTINPWAVAKCLAKCAFRRNSCKKHIRCKMTQ